MVIAPDLEIGDTVVDERGHLSIRVSFKNWASFIVPSDLERPFDALGKERRALEHPVNAHGAVRTVIMEHDGHRYVTSLWARLFGTYGQAPTRTKQNVVAGLS